MKRRYKRTLAAESLEIYLMYDHKTSCLSQFLASATPPPPERITQPDAPRCALRHNGDRSY